MRGASEGHTWANQVRSGITLRDTWSKRQAGAMRPVRRAGWVWAVSCAPAARAAVAGCTCAGAAHKHPPLILSFLFSETEDEFGLLDAVVGPSGVLGVDQRAKEHGPSSNHDDVAIRSNAEYQNLNIYARGGQKKFGSPPRTPSSRHCLCLVYLPTDEGPKSRCQELLSGIHGASAKQGP